MTPSKTIIAFTVLPEEIVIEVLAHLDCRSLLCTGSTCRLLYEICKGSLELQCIVELAKDNLRMPEANLSHSDILSRLQERRLSWAEVQWKRLIKLEISNNCVAYELVAGIFAMSDGHSLSMTTLPSSTSTGTPTREFPSLGILVRDIAIDPTQDLLVILEDDHSPISFTESRHVRIHIRTLSSNEPHPGVSREILEFDVVQDETFGNGIFTALLELSVDVVALLINKGTTSPKPRLLIWNWKNGTPIYDSESIGEVLSQTVQSFSLLSRNSFVLTSINGPGALHVYYFDPDSFILSVPTLCAALHFPSIHSHCTLIRVGIHSGPITSGHPETSTFSVSPESHLIVLSLLYTMHSIDSPHSASYSLFVHKRTLLDYVSRFMREDDLKAAIPARNTHVDWDDWGEVNTRLMVTPSPRPWLRYVHGQRVVSNYPGSRSIELIDFNIISSLSITNKPSNFHLHDEPSSRYPSSLFQNGFVTRLPYYSTTRDVGESFYACMIDEERIIGLKLDNSDNMSLYVYQF